VYYLVARRLSVAPSTDHEMASREERAIFGQAVKQAFAAALEPVVTVIAHSGVHPHFLTLLCVALSVLAAVLLATGELLGGGIVAATASIFDYLDGRLARRSGKTSLAGNFIDSTGDRAAELALFAGLAFFFRDSAFILAMTLVASAGAILTSYARAKAESLGLALKTGWLQRPERMTLLCASATLDPLLPGLSTAFDLGPHPVLCSAICLLALLGSITAVQRVWLGVQAAQRKETSGPPS
jgi:phosphatidylglycerophosphate synthase